MVKGLVASMLAIVMRLLNKRECMTVLKEEEKWRKIRWKDTRYYERWASNHSSRQKALAGLHQMQTVHIVECRRVLKWTYAYGYYLPEHEHAKKQFFEYLQGETESGLERLHQCAGKELQQYLNADGPSKEFNDFRTKLAGVTSVTRNYFENLVMGLENGLSDVDSNGTASGKGKSSKNATGSSKGRGGRGKGTTRTSSSNKND